MRLANKRQAFVVAGLSLASAATEGIGLILLVPMLGLLSGSSNSDAGFNGVFSFFSALNSIELLLGLFVILVLVRGLLNLGLQLAAKQLETSLVDGLRNRAWNALLHCDWRVLAGMRQSDSSSFLISSVDMIGYGVSQTVGSVAAAATLVGITVAALAIAPVVTLFAVIGGAIVLYAYRGLRRRSRILGEAHNQAYAMIHAEVGEGLAAIRIIKSLGVEDRFSRQLRDHFESLRDAQRQFIRDVGIGQILLQGGGAMLLAAIVWLAVSFWGATVSATLPMVALFVRALPLLAALQQASQNSVHALPALGRALALLAEAERGREADPPAGVSAPRATSSIRMEGVSVCYPNRCEPALDNVSLELRPGLITALVGASGAGKSSAADVLGGLISPSSGNLVIDDVVLDGGMRRAWREQVAYVQQDPVMFSGTVRENLLLSAPDATSADMLEALRRASAGFVELMPSGLDTHLAERGLRLSGGERQRIALARALLRKPRLLILDEAASALDSDNEAAISAAVSAMRDELMILIIGHRGSLAGTADRVFQLENGRLVRSGDTMGD